MAPLRTEYKENPLGIDARKPRLSWQIACRRRGASRQSAYEIRVARERRGRPAANSCGTRAAWRPTSPPSAPTKAPPSQSGQRYHWQVRVWDGSGRRVGVERAGLLGDGPARAADWKASWIEPDLPEDVEDVGPGADAAPRVHSSSGAVAQARAYVTSHGLYEMHLNGRRVGDQLFTPGWTSYNKRLQYQTYDVTPLC